MKEFRVVPLVAAAFAIVALSPGTVAADTFYVDPKNGSASGDGSKSDPWETFEQVVDDGLIETQKWDGHPYDKSRSLVPKNQGAPVGPGDTLILKEGYHGTVEIEEAYNETDITVRAATGETAKLSSLELQSGSHWVVEGLTVSPSFGPSYDGGTMIGVENHDWTGPSRNVTIKNCDLYSVPDATSWSASDWDSKAANGIGVEGSDAVVVGNTVRNSDFAISVSGSGARVAGNTIDGFSGDGLRGLGDNGVFEYNVIKNAYDVNKNHDDGFQSWTSDGGDIGAGTVEGIVLRGNLFLNHEDPSHPLRTSLQGIGCFDGMFVDWTVVNNVIITDHWHGITLLGARDSKIVNNTVIDLDDSEPGPPWIKVDDHKDGTASENVVIRNNLATSIQGGQGVTTDHNIELQDPSKHFVDPGNFDLHLVETSAAVDAGTSMGAPMIDRDRIPRPQGSAFDLGAYEWHDGSAMPVDAGSTSDAGGDTGDQGDPPPQDAGADTGSSSDDTGGGTGGGSDASASNDGGSDGGGSGSEGCSCSASPDGSPLHVALLFAVVVVVRLRIGATASSPSEKGASPPF